MGSVANDRRIDCVEFPATDVAETKAFYTQAFEWEFTDYGPENGYAARTDCPART
jgi:predicted enzyme related to lactoylglutathione lyase